MRVLQPIFSRPKLRSRLLSKPPFRFIHDIVFAIIQSTKFPPTGLFTEAELDSSTFKNNKEAKIAFLDKLIALVNASRESPVLVESRNIVAGAQPASTLNLLVAFGKLAQDDDIDHASLIQLTTRTEMAEEESKVDGTSEETKEDFDESKVYENDIVEEGKDDDLGEVCNSECFQSMSMTDAIARIIESASIIESLFTER
ncbi:TRAF3-interacting protein 1 [Skeletonema marinoi]|uniref:TRAF3-interacting protein 1 n=1 Tax=Skeletonema marinoi TaxID=267567 RepID=A0AAD8YDZ9_9STRA|nr:TRAF3-interacting protein 1 [Skeletonema marinoi]